jgi:hypothetical protein
MRNFALPLVILSIIAGMSPGNSLDATFTPAAGQEKVQKPPVNFCSEVLDRVMPPGGVGVYDFPKDSKWLLPVRITAPFDRKEILLSLKRLYNGNVAATMLVPPGQSVSDQCLAMKSQNPSYGLDEVVPKIELARLTVSSKELPTLIKIANEIMVIQIPATLPDELGNDETRYEVSSQSQYGQRLTIVLSGPGSESLKQPSPILSWVERFLKLMRNYEKRQHVQSDHD